MEQQSLTTVREINSACKDGRVSLFWRDGKPTGSTVYGARTVNGVLQVQLRRGDTRKGYWVKANAYLVQKEP